MFRMVRGGAGWSGALDEPAILSLGGGITALALFTSALRTRLDDRRPPSVVGI
jgi:hypothetical protein